jgi:hypothetical protein
MLCDFAYAYDEADKVWRAPKSPSTLAGGGKYSWATPLFSTFHLASNAGLLRLGASMEEPGMSSFASFLWDHLTITTVHLPLVPSSVDDDRAWEKLVLLPEHQEALNSRDLRQWLCYLAHSDMAGGRVEMPQELRAHPIFRKSAEMAEGVVSTPEGCTYSEKEMADFALQAQREKEAAVAAAALQAQREKEAAVAPLAAELAALRAELEQLRRPSS